MLSHAFQLAGVRCPDDLGVKKLARLAGIQRNRTLCLDTQEIQMRILREMTTVDMAGMASCPSRDCPKGAGWGQRLHKVWC